MYIARLQINVELLQPADVTYCTCSNDPSRNDPGLLQLKGQGHLGGCAGANPGFGDRETTGTGHNTNIDNNHCIYV